MHAKTDSEVTSLAASSPPRSPRRPAYYVMSPSQADVERASLNGSTPGRSPVHQHYVHPEHHRYMSSPIQHSRESSTTRFSASLKNGGSWRKIPQTTGRRGRGGEEGDGGGEEDEDEDVEEGMPVRCYVALFVLGFALLFSLFSLILWSASKPYKPNISVKSVMFESYNVQAGMDLSGVPTKMLTIKCTVKMSFRNPATFFGVHVSSTPWELFYYDLRIASGLMPEFYESRKSERVVKTRIEGIQVPLYGGGAMLSSKSAGGDPAVVPLNLTFVVRARAYVLGHLVKSKFYRNVRCSVVLRETHLGKAFNPKKSCTYDD